MEENTKNQVGHLVITFGVARSIQESTTENQNSTQMKECQTTKIADGAPPKIITRDRRKHIIQKADKVQNYQSNYALMMRYHHQSKHKRVCLQQLRIRIVKVIRIQMLIINPIESK